MTLQTLPFYPSNLIIQERICVSGQSHGCKGACCSSYHFVACYFMDNMPTSQTRTNPKQTKCRTNQVGSQDNLYSWDCNLVKLMSSSLDQTRLQPKKIFRPRIRCKQNMILDKKSKSVNLRFKLQIWNIMTHGSGHDGLETKPLHYLLTYNKRKELQDTARGKECLTCDHLCWKQDAGDQDSVLNSPVSQLPTWILMQPKLFSVKIKKGLFSAICKCGKRC